MHLDADFEQVFRVNERRFVAQVLGTSFELLLKVGLHIRFELLVVGQVNAVPKLGQPRVQVVYRVQVHIFLVPPKHGLPSANIDVGRGDPLELGALEAVAKDTSEKADLLEKGLDLAEVPRHAGIKHRTRHVSTVNGSGILEHFPKLKVRSCATYQSFDFGVLFRLDVGVEVLCFALEALQSLAVLEEVD